MKSRTTKEFWDLYHALPQRIQTLADKAYTLWLENPSYPGLYFKRIDPEDPIYSVRISRRYRALGTQRGDTVTWFWIGKHEIYDRLLR